LCNLFPPSYLVRIICPVWAYYAHGWQCRCQEDPVRLPSSRLEKTTRSSPHHVAQHHPTGSETTPSYAPQSSRFGSEPPSVEDDVDVWRYAIVSCMPETTTTTNYLGRLSTRGCTVYISLVVNRSSVLNCRLSFRYTLHVKSSEVFSLDLDQTSIWEFSQLLDLVGLDLAQYKWS